MIHYLKSIFKKKHNISEREDRLIKALNNGYDYAQKWNEESNLNYSNSADNKEFPIPNTFISFLNNREIGKGIWKWNHYFEIYHKHFSKFIGKEVTIMEIGIYSGGSLEMWQSYFGSKCHIYGVDIESACRCYNEENVTIFIGDQENKDFWDDIKKKNIKIDILIDDGGHTPEQQRITLEEMLPHINPGGIYLCEDIHGVNNEFALYTSGLVNELNAMTLSYEELLSSSMTEFQKVIHSIHYYPYVLVIEKHNVKQTSLIAPKRGSEWQPFTA